MNALKHGLSARTVVLNHEDEIGYHEVRGSLYRQYQPATPQECMLVDQLASSWWRTIRARQYETDMMNMQVDTLKRRHKNRKTVHTKESDRQALAVALTVEPQDDFKTFFRYDAAIERSFYRALNQLERMQKERRKAEESTETWLRFAGSDRAAGRRPAAAYDDRFLLEFRSCRSSGRPHRILRRLRYRQSRRENRFIDRRTPKRRSY
jgi:hypothetical protein